MRPGFCHVHVNVDSGGVVSSTDAALPVRGELEASVADALEAALCVDAAAIATHYPVHNALVNVCERNIR